MTDLSASLNNIIADGHATRLYLSTPVEVTVLEGQVTASPANPMLSIAYSNLSGSYTDVLADMEAEAFRSGISLGRFRVRTLPTSAILYVEEISHGRLQLQIGDTFKVYRSWRLRDRIVASNVAFDKDSGIGYTDQTDLYKPVANAGGAVARFVDNTTSLITVAFDGTGSYTVDPDSTGVKTYAWVVGDGTVTVGSLTTGTLTATFPAGFRWISLTVTDSSNSKTQMIYVPVWAHTRTGVNAPLDVFNITLNGMLESGWEADTEVGGGATYAQLPDGALVCLWSEDTYAGATPAAYGGLPDRGHIRFTGYLVSDANRLDAEDTPNTTYRAVSPLGILMQLPGFSQVFENKAVPTNWQQGSDVSTTTFLDYLARWHTTLNVCHDFRVSVTNYLYPLFFAQELVPAEQLREIASAVGGVVTGDRHGRIIIRPRLNLLDTAARAALATTLTLTEQHVRSLSYERAHRYRYKQLEARGIVANSSSPVFSRAPGNAPAEAPDSTTVDRLIVASQANLNARAGRHYANDNALYFGLPTLRNLEVTLPGNFDVFDFADAEWVSVNVPSTYTRRGNAISLRGEVERISIRYDAETGTRDYTLSLIPETDGAPGATYTPPPTDAPFIDVPPIDLVPTGIAVGDIPMILPWDNITRYPVRVRGIGTNGTIFRDGSYDVTTNTLTLEEVTGSVTGVGIWMLGDPYAPNTVFALTENGLWKCAAFDAVTPSWTLVCAMTAITGAASTALGTKLAMSINRRGWMCVTGYLNVLSISTDYGATWTRRKLDALKGESWAFVGANAQQLGDYRNAYCVNVAVSPRNAGSASGFTIYASTPGYGNFGGTPAVFKSTDGGVTWTNLGPSINSNLVAGLALNVPYEKSPGVANPNGATQWVYAAATEHVANNTGGDLYKSLNGGASWASIASSGDAVGKDGVHTFTHDGRITAWGHRRAFFGGVQSSRDSGATLIGDFNFLASQAGQISIHGFSTAPEFLLAFSPGNGNNFLLAWSTDFGVTWTTPALPSWLTASTGFIAYAEGY